MNLLNALLAFVRRHTICDRAPLVVETAARPSRTNCVTRALLLLLLFMQAGVLQAQFIYVTNNGTITITGTILSLDGPLTIPSTIHGLRVTAIGDRAFETKHMTSVTIPDTVVSIGQSAFSSCVFLSNVTLGNGLITIGSYAFSSCNPLTNMTIPKSVTSIGDYAFYYCTKLEGIYFEGNAPSLGADVFLIDNKATVYYLPGTIGWGSMFGGRPTAQWLLPNPLILNNPNFGVGTNGFGFVVSWATNLSVAVDTCTNLANPIWCSVGTNALMGGWFYFSDPQWTSYPARFYRIRSP
jgi:hypothetical protein